MNRWKRRISSFFSPDYRVCVHFTYRDEETDEVIVALRGTDEPNTTDWVANRPTSGMEPVEFSRVSVETGLHSRMDLRIRTVAQLLAGSISPVTARAVVSLNLRKAGSRSRLILQ